MCLSGMAGFSLCLFAIIIYIYVVCMYFVGEYFDIWPFGEVIGNSLMTAVQCTLIGLHNSLFYNSINCSVVNCWMKLVITIQMWYGYLGCN